MSMILRNAIHKAVTRKARGLLGFRLRNGRGIILDSVERETLRKRAQDTPFLDEMLAICKNKQQVTRKTDKK